MKRLLAMSILTVAISAATASTKALPIWQSNDPVESIRQHYASINQSASRYRRVKKELMGFSPEGGEMTAYFHGPTVMKIMATHFGESGRTIEEYYFWNGKLIFVLSVDNRYDQPFGKVVRKEETRLYFKDDKLIRWLNDLQARYGVRVDNADIDRQATAGLVNARVTLMR